VNNVISSSKAKRSDKVLQRPDRTVPMSYLSNTSVKQHQRIPETSKKPIFVYLVQFNQQQQKGLRKVTCGRLIVSTNLPEVQSCGALK
jgi:hypothetical protein